MSARIIASAAILAVLAATTVLAEEFNPVIGKSSELTLRESDLDRIIAGQPPEARKQLEDNADQKAGIVGNILLKMAIAQKARKEGFDRKPEVREMLAYAVNEFLSREYIAKQVIDGIKVPEEELEKYYKEHEKDLVVPASVKARHIFIKLSDKATEKERLAATSKAEKILERLKSGEDFAKLAAEESDDADSAKNGGELGIISPGKTNSRAFEEAAIALKAGEISPIITTLYGLHIIKADEKTEQRTATFAEARNMIAAKLQSELEQKKGVEFVDRIIKESGIEVYKDKISGVKAPEMSQ